MSSNRPIGNKGCPDRNTDLDIVHLSFGPAISGGSVCDHQALYCVMLGSGSFRKAHSGKVDRVNADLYLRRALGTLIISQRAVPTPIKCATSKSKFTISINSLIAPCPSLRLYDYQRPSGQRTGFLFDRPPADRTKDFSLSAHIASRGPHDRHGFAAFGEPRCGFSAQTSSSRN